MMSSYRCSLVPHANPAIAGDYFMTPLPVPQLKEKIDDTTAKYEDMRHQMINEIQQKYYESQRTHSGNKAHKHGSGNRNDPFAANERISFSDYQEMLQ